MLVLMLRAKGRIVFLIGVIGLFLFWSRSERHIGYSTKTGLSVAIAVISLLLLIYQRTEGRQPLNKEDQPGFNLGEDEIALRFQAQLRQYRAPTFVFFIAGIGLCYWEKNYPASVPFPRYAFLIACTWIVIGGWLNWKLISCPLCKERPPNKMSGAYLFGPGPSSCPRCGVRFIPSA